MNKLSLRLDDLQVESFEPLPPSTARGGTVLGHKGTQDDTCRSCIETCEATCRETCDESCRPTCGESCRATCHGESCEDTCGQGHPTCAESCQDTCARTCATCLETCAC